MKIWKCGRFELPLGHKTYVMGIINATPDSFSGDGTYCGAQTWNRGEKPEAMNHALEQAQRMIEDGADILDIGGESTRPGAQPVSASEELRRVLPLIEHCASRLKVPISVDTTKAEVARACLQAGASIINDISGGTFDARLLPTIADSRCGVILMHLRGTPQTMKASAAFNADLTVRSTNASQNRARVAPANSPNVADVSNVADVPDVIEEILKFWAERVEVAQQAGIAPERIVLDAGFGFGKSLDENLEILRRGAQLSSFGFPTMSAISRKSTLGRVLAQAQSAQREAEAEVPRAGEALVDAPLQERQWATAAGVALAIAGGCDIVRVHDVREMAQVARMADAATRVA